MTTEEAQIVRRTWRLLQQIDPVLLGDVFYSRLFLEAPSVEAMFKTSKEVQAKKLVDMLNMIVTRLNRLHELSADIRSMTLRHVGYGVEPIHYEQVGSALIWTLKTALGNDWTPAVEGAWLSCYATLTQVMLSSLDTSAEELTN